MTHIQLDYGKALEFFGQHEMINNKISLKQFIKRFTKVLVQVVIS